MLDLVGNVAGDLAASRFRIKRLFMRNLSTTTTQDLKLLCTKEGFSDSLNSKKGLTGINTEIVFSNGVHAGTLGKFLELLKDQIVVIYVSYDEKHRPALEKLHTFMIQMTEWPNVKINHLTRKYRNK